MEYPDDTTLLCRYQRAVSRLWNQLPRDPLGDSTAQLRIERFEALVDGELLGLRPEPSAPPRHRPEPLVIFGPEKIGHRETRVVVTGERIVLEVASTNFAGEKQWSTCSVSDTSKVEFRWSGRTSDIDHVAGNLIYRMYLARRDGHWDPPPPLQYQTPSERSERGAAAENGCVVFGSYLGGRVVARMHEGEQHIGFEWRATDALGADRWVLCGASSIEESSIYVEPTWFDVAYRMWCNARCERQPAAM